MSANDYNEHLRQAETRIAEALRRIEEHEARMQSRRLSAEEQERAAALLRSMRGSLALFEQHRDSLVQLIAVTRRRDA
jgi:Na+/phosphate symporter